MFWPIVGMIAGTLLLGVVLVRRPCDAGQMCELSTQETSPPLSIIQAAATCENVLQAVGKQKQQLQHRLQMLDELIEKSDREIGSMQEQIARMSHIRTSPLDETGQDMLKLLNASGFHPDEIARFTHRDCDDLYGAA